MKTQSERLKEVRKKLNNISQGRLAEMSELSLSTVQRIEHGTMEISDASMQILKEKLNVNPVFLKTGKGEVFIDGVIPEVKLTDKGSLTNPWKDALISELKDEITYYRELLKIMAGAGKAPANFLKTLNMVGADNALLRVQA